MRWERDGSYQLGRVATQQEAVTGLGCYGASWSLNAFHACYLLCKNIIKEKDCVYTAALGNDRSIDFSEMMQYRCNCSTRHLLVNDTYEKYNMNYVKP